MSVPVHFLLFCFPTILPKDDLSSCKEETAGTEEMPEEEIIQAWPAEPWQLSGYVPHDPEDC